MGNTTKKAINRDRFSDPIQISASIIKDATGTDFKNNMGGSKKSSRRGKRKAAPPVTMPAAKERKKPRLIFPKEKAMVFQNSMVRICDSSD
ncbi:hypothetical protein LXJ15735_36710 [Lacrimispora xylanolytica]